MSSVVCRVCIYEKTTPMMPCSFCDSVKPTEQTVCFVVQLIETQQAAMEWHEDLQNLAQQQGLKGKKLNKARNGKLHLVSPWPRSAIKLIIIHLFELALGFLVFLQTSFLR